MLFPWRQENRLSDIIRKRRIDIRERAGITERSVTGSPASYFLIADR